MNKPAPRAEFETPKATTGPSDRRQRLDLSRRRVMSEGHTIMSEPGSA